MDYPTPLGVAHVALDVPTRPRAVLVLGHGAGGDIHAADLQAARRAALSLGVAVVRLRQPYRVAGRRAPAPAAQLDQVFLALLAGLRALPGLSRRLPVVVGGRSSGARVAARTARSGGAVGLLALAFPLVPPGRPGTSRVDELLASGVPSLVVQGARDPFGTPDQVRQALGRAAPDLEVADVADADHSFRTRAKDPTTTAEALGAVESAVQAWLAERFTGPGIAGRSHGVLTTRG